jgi:hypothetical protein
VYDLSNFRYNLNGSGHTLEEAMCDLEKAVKAKKTEMNNLLQLARGLDKALAELGESK